MLFRSLNDVTTANYNTVVGSYAGSKITTDGNSTLIGFRAGEYLTESHNVFVGMDAGRYAYNVDTSVLIGYSAGEYIGQGNTDSQRVVAVGFEAGKYATGSYNTFIGYTSGRGGTTSAPYSSGTHNVAIGYVAFDAFTSAYRCTVEIGRAHV